MGNYNFNSGYGQALLHGIRSVMPAFGKVFFVFNSSNTDEENYDRMQQIMTSDPAGIVRFHTSLAAAYAECESNNNDVIILDGNSTHSLSSMLTVAKNRVHFMGLDWLMGIRRRYGQSTKVSLGVTTAATDIGTIKVTGVRCSFRGIKFINENTVAEGIYCFVDGGEYTYVDCCEIYKSTDLDVTGAAELVMNGDSSHYRRCYIGSTANAISGAIIRPCVTFTGGLAGAGKKSRDVTFEDCIFARKCGNAANNFMYGANATDLERLHYVKDCIFYNNLLAAADPDECIEFGAAQTEGSMVLKGCASVSCTQLSSTTGVFTADPASDAAGGEATQMA